MTKTITTNELAKKIMNQEDTFILDVRNNDAFSDWKIEGKKVESLNEPYFNLMDGVDSITDKLPKDRNVNVICAKGKSSEMVTDMLEEAGYTNAYSLEGGMKGWSEHLEPVKLGDLKDGGAIYQFVRLGKGCLSYFIESNGEAAIVDAARMTESYENFAKERGVKIKHVLDTHLHADHISGGRKLAKNAGGTYYLPSKDAEEVTFNYTSLEEGKTIHVGNTSVTVQPIYSPGHTIGSTSLVVDETYLLTGDTLFVQSIGRPDLAGKAEDWVEDLRSTLYSRYTNLSDDLIVLPAHFSFVEELAEDGSVSARLGDLYQKNTGLQVEDEDKFRKMVTENLPPQPNAYEEIRKTNMGKMNPENEQQRDMEVGPNRCAIG
ncbi:MBL fold metallo-hydrolase [Virgibacillus alimentarius]|uniref:Glyoxylase-like metal-dependent hydrolase (Beta-lactamase superfamily II) n=1 Tax=Virgibacillus alimentarius TaxID=698769 RepID=A0ABS4SB27_9BACI|nr:MULTISPECIES: MBL fold metallo-hydrolase [Virgibacillus]MBP2258711.1 glyoxylase-like metal-dependent hydrolase (beta-lactamase superfamily II) [Virgibacillus alimentarius]HLR66733.1 MBL fold metallo-hydrolase [Virgibacillus sp.]